MGAGGSVETLPHGARKLQNFIAMKAFNLRQNEQKTLNEQFQFLIEQNERDDEKYMDFDALCKYLQIPTSRQDTLRIFFQSNQINYKHFLHLLENAAASVPINPTTQVKTPSDPLPTKSISISINNQIPEHSSTQLVCLSISNPIQIKKNLPNGLWKKREITIQERIVEYTKIDENGIPQNLIEKEKHQHEIIHMESLNGEFAHREITYFEQSEELNKEIVHFDTGKEEFLHLKSKEDEISHFESNMPQTKQDTCDQSPPSPTIKKDSSEYPIEPETTQE